MALTLTFMVTNEDGFGGREVGRERYTALGEHDVLRRPKSLSGQGGSSHPSPRKCGLQSLLPQTSGRWWRWGRGGGGVAAGEPEGCWTRLSPTCQATQAASFFLPSPSSDISPS